MSEFFEHLKRELDAATAEVSARVDAWIAETDEMKRQALYAALRRDGILKWRGEQR